MYSLLFIANVRDEYKSKCQDLKKTYDKKIAELYKKHKIPFELEENSIAAKIKREKEKEDSEEEPPDKDEYL